MRYFDIKYVRHEVDLGQVAVDIRKEINGPGRLVGYRSEKKCVKHIATIFQEL